MDSALETFIGTFGATQSTRGCSHYVSTSKIIVQVEPALLLLFASQISLPSSFPLENRLAIFSRRTTIPWQSCKIILKKATRQLRNPLWTGRGRVAIGRYSRSRCTITAPGGTGSQYFFSLGREIWLGSYRPNVW